MSSEQGKTNFGATIQHVSDSTDNFAQPRRLHLSTITEKDSLRSSNAPSIPSTSGTITPTSQSPNPFSNLSGDPSYPAVEKGFSATETDLEAGFGSPVFPQASRSIANSNGYDPQKLSLENTKECSMWPAPATLRQERKQRKQLRRNKWNCWGKLTNRMSKKQIIALQVLIVLLVVGAAVGIGIGVSKAVGGGVWSGDGESNTIPNN